MSVRRALSPFTTIAVLSAAIVLAALACGGSDGVEIVREREGVRLELRADKEEYGTGDTVEITAAAENLRDVPLTFGPGLPAEPLLAIHVISELGGEQLLNPLDERSEESRLTLDPGGTVEASARWEQDLALYAVPVQAPEGEYTITATLTIEDPDGGSEPIDLSAAIVVRLTGGEAIVPVTDAIRTAIEQQELKAWAAERLATAAVCSYQPTGEFFLATVQADEVEPSTLTAYQNALSEGSPVCAAVSLGDEWRIQFFTADGPDPQRVSVYMEIHSGENVRFEEGAPPIADSAPDSSPQ